MRDDGKIEILEHLVIRNKNSGQTYVKQRVIKTPPAVEEIKIREINSINDELND